MLILHANDVFPTNADGTFALHQNANLFYLTAMCIRDSGISCGTKNGNGCPDDDGGHFFLVGPLFGNCGGF